MEQLDFQVIAAKLTHPDIKFGHVFRIGELV